MGPNGNLFGGSLTTRLLSGVTWMRAVFFIAGHSLRCNWTNFLSDPSPVSFSFPRPFLPNPSRSQGFCNPSNNSFNYPATTGISYSFTETGFFEEAQYRFTANASNPRCITAFILWQHGTYKLADDGSMTLHPFSADGRIQVQDPCAATTNIITYYNQEVSH